MTEERSENIEIPKEEMSFLDHLEELRWHIMRSAIAIAKDMTEERSENIEIPKEEMSFLDHLEELRWHIMRSAIAIISLGVIAFINKKFVFDGIILGPKNSDFLTFRLLCRVSLKLNELIPSIFGADTLCIGQNMPQLQNINMAGQFTSHIMTSIVVGLIVAFPYVFWEIWRFVSPGLKDGERIMYVVLFLRFLFYFLLESCSVIS